MKYIYMLGYQHRVFFMFIWRNIIISQKTLVAFEIEACLTFQARNHSKMLEIIFWFKSTNPRLVSNLACIPCMCFYGCTVETGSVDLKSVLACDFVFPATRSISIYYLQSSDYTSICSHWDKLLSLVVFL